MSPYRCGYIAFVGIPCIWPSGVPDAARSNSPNGPQSLINCCSRITGEIYGLKPYGKDRLNRKMNKEGFSLIVFPYHGGNGRQFEIYGFRLLLFRILFMIVVIILISAIFIMITGLLNRNETQALREHISVLENSLRKAQEVELRIVEIESELENIRIVRSRVENILSLAAQNFEDSQ
jgi:hypothetical protein